jgi:hypothetical protein
VSVKACPATAIRSGHGGPGDDRCSERSQALVSPDGTIILSFAQAQDKARTHMVRRVQLANGIVGPLNYLEFLEARGKSAVDARHRTKAFATAGLRRFEGRRRGHLTWSLRLEPRKAYAVTQPMCDGMSIRLFNGRRVEIVPDKLTFGESLRHQQSRKADAASDIGNPGPRL